MFQLLHKAVKGGLTDLTLCRIDRGWQAASRWHDSTGWEVHTDKEAEDALSRALAVSFVDTGEDLC